MHKLSITQSKIFNYAGGGRDHEDLVTFNKLMLSYSYYCCLQTGTNQIAAFLHYHNIIKI